MFVFLVVSAVFSSSLCREESVESKLEVVVNRVDTPSRMSNIAAAGPMDGIRRNSSNRSQSSNTAIVALDLVLSSEYSDDSTNSCADDSTKCNNRVQAFRQTSLHSSAERGGENGDEFVPLVFQIS